MLFITDRFPRQSIRSRWGRRFDFDLANNAPSNSVFFCERRAAGGYTEIGSSALLDRLKQSDYRQLLIFIHGFSNLPEDVFAAATELQELCDAAQPREALVLPVVWPCDDDCGIVQDYWDDEKAADLSAASLARALNRFLAWRNAPAHNPPADPCLKRINILAHSMGNRVLRQTLVAWNRYDLSAGVPLLFRNTFLVAADIVNESLEPGQDGELICHASRNVTVYYASDDLALRASKAANLRNAIASRRLGHTGPEDMARTPKNVYAVDCDDVNTAYDYPKGHSYFRYGRVPGEPGVVFQHLFAALQSGRVFPDDEFRRTTILRDR
ncbi:MAG: alpha/beta hydrolase [Salinisphaera sp.]|nr:alpha/beta hydrolase [Salinisphaera sp.]